MSNHRYYERKKTIDQYHLMRGMQSTINARLPVSSSGAGICFSDRRLKKDITYLSTLENGIRLYSFRYTWSNDFTYVGVMAQDLLLSPMHKDAVTLEKNSFYSVDYHSLGLRMITMSEWQESHHNILHHVKSLGDTVAA